MRPDDAIAPGRKKSRQQKLPGKRIISFVRYGESADQRG